MPKRIYVFHEYGINIEVVIYFFAALHFLVNKNYTSLIFEGERQKQQRWIQGVVSFQQGHYSIFMHVFNTWKHVLNNSI